MAQYAIYFGFETYQDEVALFEVRDEADIETTKRFLQLRIDELLANAVNYPELDTARLKNAVIGAAAATFTVSPAGTLRRCAPPSRTRSAEF